MTITELNQIVESLKLTSKEKMIDEAFQYFIDNQINIQELKYILDNIKYKLRDEFYDMDIDYQKRYHQHKERVVTFTDKGVVTIEKEIFNKPYFYELVEASKKNKAMTLLLISYARKLDSLPISFVAMKYIRLKNLNYALTHNWLEYADKYDIKNLYDFYMHLAHAKKTKDILKMIDQLIAFLKKDTLLKLDLDLPFVKFAFDVESILSRMNPKIANTIRIRFLVYKPEYINDNEYNKTMENPRTLINKHKASFVPREIKELTEYYSKDNKKILDSFNDNGYRAIYYSILEEVAI